MVRDGPGDHRGDPGPLGLLNALVGLADTVTARPGATIGIVVSKGPEMVAVPSVEGLSRSAATTKLEAAGFKVAVQTFLGGPLDEVRASRPSGGTAPKGSTVTILVV